MAQQLQVNLSFTADSAKAKAQIQDLQNSLNNLTRTSLNQSSSAKGLLTGFDWEISKAQKDVAQLQLALKNAVNTNTGKLNLNLFNQSLKESGMSLKQYQDSLSILGKDGERAFINLAKSIMTAEAPLRTTNKLLSDFWISLKNVAKYQISTTLWRGLTTGLSSAFTYAEDLNKSLNQIQIVTNNSAEQMARFAKQANIAAKELSTTTTAYTDASLIYYQQGLDDANVKARTDITIKAANAAGTSAEEMADYLTAVWNSYKVSSDELERYVDVMAALGAGTATSLEEISTAMEKVASVGEATGVKFEQMSSIIATVSSVTRQSAETVGTAFKTIFARMADLKLDGSVEEDGVTTTLGTVSKQLAQVGVNILDANGELRDMGDVTEELMGKWNTMNEATQQAVAIAVAGKRQYTQLLALMNNQDMYKEAMNMATGAEGTLQEQADTYAKSWEAAQKRVKAAAQGIYDSLINDDFFIGVNDIIAKILSSFENMIDKIGGFKGVLLTLGGIIVTVFKKDIASSISTTIQSLMSLTAVGRNKITEQKKEAAIRAENLITNSPHFSGGFAADAEGTAIRTQAQSQTKFLENAEKLNEYERQLVSYLLDQQEILAKNVIEQGKLTQKKQEELEASKGIFTGVQTGKGEFEDFEARYETRTRQASGGKMLKAKTNNFVLDINSNDVNRQEAAIQGMSQYLQKLKDVSEETDISWKKLFGSKTAKALIVLQELLNNFGENGKKDITKIIIALQQMDEAIDDNIGNFERNVKDKYVGENGDARQEIVRERARGVPEEERQEIEQQTNTEIDNFINSADAAGEAIIELISSETEFGNFAEGIGKSLDEMGKKMPTTTEAWMNLGSVLLNVGMAFSMIQGAIRTLADPEISGVEKFITILTTLGMLIPMVVSSIKLFTDGTIKQSLASIAATVALSGETVAIKAKEKASLKAALATEAHGKAIWSLLGPMGAAIALVSAAIGIFVLIGQQQENYRKKLEKTAKETQKAADEQRALEQNISSLVESMDSLIEKFDAQKSAGEDASNTYVELGQKLGELKEQYEKAGVSAATLSLIDQGAAIANATGNWDSYNDAIKKANKEMAKVTGNKSLQEAKDTLSSTLAKGAKITLNPSGKTSDKEKTILDKHSDIFYKDTDAVGADMGYNFGMGLTQGEFIKDYEELSQTLTELKEAGLENTKVYTNLNKAFSDMSEGYKVLKESYTTNSNFILQEGFEKLFGEDFSPSQITDLNTYAACVEKLSNETKSYFGSTEEATKQTKTFLSSFGVKPELQQTYDFLTKFKTKQDEIINGNNEIALDRDKKESQFMPSDGNGQSPEQYLESQIEQMYNFINSISDDRKQIAFKINLDYIDSFESFKTAFDKTEGFEKKVKLTVDPQQVLDESLSIRNNLAESMESFSKQGYLTTTQTTELLKEFPQYEKYLVQMGDGYGFTSEAIKDFNNALENQKQALNDLLSPANIGKEALVELGEQFIYLEAGADSENLKNFALQMQDLSNNFIEGKKSLEDYFDELNSNLGTLNLDNLSTEDNLLLLNETFPKLIKSVLEFGSANKEAFDNGKISATDYRKSLRQVVDETTKFYEMTIKVAENQKNSFSDKEIKNFTDSQKKAYDELNNKITEAQKKTKEYQDIINDFNDVEFIAAAFEKNYNNLVDIFDENDFSIKINTEEEFNKARANLLELANDFQSGFSQMSDEARQNVYTLIDDMVMASYNGNTEVARVAKGILDGTVDLATIDTQTIAQAEQVAGKAATETGQKVGTYTDQIIDGISDLINNFNATITFTPSSIDFSTVNISIGPFKDIPIKIPSFSIGIEGKLGEGTSKTLSSITEAAKNLFNDSGALGGLNAFKPKSIGGNPNSPKLDSPPDTKDSSGKSGSDGSKDKPNSSSKPETADLKNLDEEITRYKNIDNQLDSIENHLDKISRKKDQAYGKKYINALDEENKALQKQINLHKQSQSDAIKYQAQDKQKVAELGFNIETDESGYITNEEQFDAWVAQSENAIELRYTNSVNALGEDSNDQKNILEGQKQAQLDNIEAAKTYFNLYKEATERRYKDESAIEELLAQQKENNYDAINKKLEIQMDLLDRERNHMEFLRNTFREGFFGIVDNFENDRAQFGNLTQQMNDLQTTMTEVQEKFKTGQISESQYIELIQDLSDRAEEAGTSLYELSEQIVGRFSEALGDANEILDNTIDKFEHLRELSDSVINLMKITYGEEAYKKLDPMLKNQEEIAKNQLLATRKIYYEAGEWLEAKRLAYEAVKGQGDQEEDAAKRMYDEALDNYNERQTQYYEALTAAAEAAMAVYENSVNKSLQDYENKLTNGLGFDALQQQLDHLQEMDELYLTNVNQQYRTQKLIRTALGDMDKTANKVAKNKIELFIKQTQELQKQGKLSEYQMSIKEKEYNILLAQLALEDAQNNKSQVRLQRDSEGNFNYIYTADEDKLLEKQQEVDDAINDLYNYEREMINKMNQRSLDNAKEAGEQLRKIAEQYGIDSKEYIKAEQELLAEHGEVITAIKEHINITQNSIDQSYLDSYNLIIDDEIAITDNWKNTFIETSNEIKTASQVLQKDTNSYMNEMNNDYIKVKDTSNDLRKEVSTNLNQISPIMNKVALDTSYWASNMNEYLGSVAAAYENIANTCATAAHTISGYMPDIDYAREFMNETDMNKMSSLLATRQYITENNIGGRGIWGKNTEGGLDLFDNINYAEVIQNTAIQGLGDTMAINAVASAAAHRIIKMQKSGDYYSGTAGTEKILKDTFGDGDIFNAIVDAMRKNNKFIGFNTGGYTGEFGPEGKFAILHEKELVLNQQDTQNLLDTVDLVDKLLNSLEYQNLLQDFNISNVGNGINKGKDTLEQDVTIHAEFPNVQDHNEIEMALSNLVNTASQYANRKKS